VSRTDHLAAVVLAAGRGRRLSPLTDHTPKPLLDVGGSTLLESALTRAAAVVPLDPEHVAVNAHWLADQIVAAVGGRAHLSLETPVALGTAGAVGALRSWLAGRDVLVTNADAFYAPTPDLNEFVAGWDRRRPRLLVVADAARPDFDGTWRFAGTSLLPAALAAGLEAVPSGLYEAVWGRVEVDLVPTTATYLDCGTPADLERARALSGC
jgi:CTP:molybdopterin cytidylyltransferase MocA